MLGLPKTCIARYMRLVDRFVSRSLTGDYADLESANKIHTACAPHTLNASLYFSGTAAFAQFACSVIVAPYTVRTKEAYAQKFYHPPCAIARSTQPISRAKSALLCAILTFGSWMSAIEAARSDQGGDARISIARPASRARWHVLRAILSRVAAMGHRVSSHIVWDAAAHMLACPAPWDCVACARDRLTEHL